MPTRWSNSISASVGLAFRHPEVQHQWLGNLVANRQDRVERGHRILEDHRDPVSADVAHLAVIQRENIHSLLAVVQQNFTVDDPARRAGDQPHDRGSGHALATAGLADDAKCFTFSDVERDSVDGVDDPGACEELGLEVVDLEDVPSHGLPRS